MANFLAKAVLWSFFANNGSHLGNTARMALLKWYWRWIDGRDGRNKWGCLTVYCWVNRHNSFSSFLNFIMC